MKVFLGRLVVAFAALLSVAEAASPEPPNVVWSEARTPHCRVIGEESPAKVQAMALAAERLVSTLERLVAGVRFSREDPLTFHGFGSNESFRSFHLGVWDAGYLVPHRHGVFAAFVTGKEPTRQIYRQIVLTALEAKYPGLPEWFRQGVADIYSNIEIEDGEVRLGLPLQGHLWVLRSSADAHRLREVLEAGTDEAAQIEDFSIWAWALVHYLAFGDIELRAKVSTYLLRVENLERPSRVFREVFGISPEELSERALAYIQADTLPYVRLPVTELPDATASVRALTETEARVALANLTLHAQPGLIGPTLQGLRALAEDEVGLPALWTTLGEAEAVAGAPQAALAALRKSAQLDPQGFKTNLLLGELLLKSAEAENDARASRVLQEAIDALERAVGLRPESPAAWEWLAFAYARHPDVPDRAIESGARALRLAPGRTDIVFNLILVHAKRGEIEDVRRLLIRLEALGSAAHRVTRARELLLQLMLREARNLMQASRLEDAIGVLAEIQSRTTDDQLRASAEEWMDRVRKVEDFNSFVKLYNEAVVAYRAEDWDSAARALDRLAPVAHPGEQARAVERLRREVEYWRN